MIKRSHNVFARIFVEPRYQFINEFVRKRYIGISQQRRKIILSGPQASVLEVNHGEVSVVEHDIARVVISMTEYRVIEVDLAAYFLKKFSQPLQCLGRCPVRGDVADVMRDEEGKFFHEFGRRKPWIEIFAQAMLRSGVALESYQDFDGIFVEAPRRSDVSIFHDVFEVAGPQVLEHYDAGVYIAPIN